MQSTLLFFNCHEEGDDDDDIDVDNDDDVDNEEDAYFENARMWGWRGEVIKWLGKSGGIHEERG